MEDEEEDDGWAGVMRVRIGGRVNSWLPIRGGAVVVAAVVVVAVGGGGW